MGKLGELFLDKLWESGDIHEADDFMYGDLHRSGFFCRGFRPDIHVVLHGFSTTKHKSSPLSQRFVRVGQNLA